MIPILYLLGNMDEDLGPPKYLVAVVSIVGWKEYYCGWWGDMNEGYKTCLQSDVDIADESKTFDTLEEAREFMKEVLCR